MRLEAALWILSSLLVPGLAVHAGAQQQPDRLYRIRLNDKYGFIDQAGKVIVPATLKEAGEFSEGLAHVRKDNHVGFIDPSGRLVIEPIFYRANSFSDGLALVLAPGATSNNGVWGYIDKTGKLVIKLQDYVYPMFEPRSFTEGRAAYCEGEKWGYIDKTGKTVIEPQFDRAFAFSEGLAKVRVGEQYGFIDQSGNMIIKPQFPRPYTSDHLGRPWPTDYDFGFHDGLAAIEMGGPPKWGYIDKTGSVIIEVPSDRFSPFSFSEGLVRMNGAHGNEGFLDTSGKVAIEPVWQTVGNFSEGLAAAEKRNNYQGGCENNNCWGYIDRTGRVIIEPQFSSAEPFHGRLAWVSVSIPRRNYSDAYKQGYIDRKGRFVWFTISK